MSATAVFHVYSHARTISFKIPFNTSFPFNSLRSLLEIAECLTGAELASAETSDQSLLLTLVAKASSHGSRILAVRFGSRDIRNAMLSGLRTLTADAMLVPPAAKGGVMDSPAGKQQRSTRRLSMREVVLEEKMMAQAGPLSSPPPKSKAEEEVRVMQCALEYRRNQMLTCG